MAALAILDALDPSTFDQLGWWLCERQVANGGLNGRPEKKADVLAPLPSAFYYNIYLVGVLLMVGIVGVMSY